MSRRIAVQAGVFCAEQPDFRPVSACGEMHILPYLALSGGLQHVVQAMWAIMIAKGFNLHKNVCPWLIRHEIMMRQFVLLKRGDRMGRLG
ncbi:predicted protein [Brucella neotomae 5K33]|uniref:Uncharacterized protein n=1 Tax=Brucella neotomae 5K33 TaxID=520456 RepID=A0A7U8K748_BRUNE|nr:predicted protein [Brucella neotomae 5K33]